MCPICLASLALTVASTTGAGAAATALAVRVKRSIAGEREPQSPCTEEPRGSRRLPRARRAPSPP
jgi:hypothetical protein